MAADEALILLAEAILLAGLLMFSARLWSARFDPYPQLVAQLLNSSPVDAELFIALPKPVRVELDRLCQADSCYSIAPLGAVYGAAWDWLIVYKRKAALAGGGVPPSPYALLAVQVRRVNHAGVDLGPVQGVQVRIMGQTYATDAGGWVNVTLVKGYTYTVEIVQTGFNNGWGRYSFYRWGDGSTENPRSVYLSDSVQLLSYVWDERLLKVTYTAGGVVRVNGTQVSSGWSSWYRYGSTVVLEAVPNSGYVLQKWQRGVNTDTLSDYDVRLKETVTASGSGGYIALSRTTTNAFSGYVELTLSFTITPSNPSFGYTYYARIEACSQYLVNEYETRTGSYSRTISWKGVLPCSSSRITFSVYYISYTWGSASMTGTALRPATNPLTVTVDNGYHYRAEFGTP
ncbi:MAG: hypothetical protein QXH81_09135 [Thermofilaceae archaeon]